MVVRLRSFRPLVITRLPSSPDLPAPKNCMDKKAKKRLDVINKKLQTLRPRLAGSKAQADDPAELKALEEEISSLEAEAAKLKAS